MTGEVDLIGNALPIGGLHSKLLIHHFSKYTETVCKEFGNLVKYWITFNYREDYHAETAFLMSNENGVFALIGDPVDYNWLSLNVVPVINDTEIDDSEELDFEML